MNGLTMDVLAMKVVTTFYRRMVLLDRDLTPPSATESRACLWT